MNELQKESVLYTHLQGLRLLFLTGYYASSSVTSDVTVYIKPIHFGSKHDTDLTMLSTKPKES